MDNVNAMNNLRSQNPLAVEDVGDREQAILSPRIYR